jgi:Zn-finger nucleic acid-binding protein
MLRERDRSGIEIDVCPQCRGVWLDRGELEKLMARESQYYTDDDGGGRSGRDRRQDDRDDWGQDDDEPQGKRGFLQNLLDNFGGGFD